jgi:hypothetical protein
MQDHLGVSLTATNRSSRFGAASVHAASMGPLLELSVEVVLPTHGAPTVRAALEHALSRPLLGPAREKAGAEQVGALDQTVSDVAIQMLLDDVRLTFLDAREAVGDVEAVGDLVDPRLDEVEHGRVAEPPGDEAARLGAPRSFPQPVRREGSELRLLGEAGRDLSLFLGSDPGDEPLGQSVLHG